MAWRERKNWVYLAVVAVTYGGYALLIAARAADAPVTEVAYVVPLLVSIGISIVATVAGTVASAIVGALSDPDGIERSDERDDVIEARGELLGYRVTSILLLVPFGMAMAEMAHFWIANAVYLAFAVAAVVSTAAKLTYYRRGS